MSFKFYGRNNFRQFLWRPIKRDFLILVLTSRYTQNAWNFIISRYFIDIDFRLILQCLQISILPF